MYEIDVDGQGQYVVRSLFDNTLIKSKETGNVISFKDIDKAEALYNVLMSNYKAIQQARNEWLVKESVDEDTYGMRKCTKNL